MSSRIAFQGNLTADPELRFTPSGAAVASFTVAVNERKYNKDTNQFEDAGATYWKCNIWRQYAENVTESLKKGDHVFVTGDVKDRTFETREGEKRTVKEVEVEDVGPTLRFAVAKPVRASRGGSNNGNGGSNNGNGGSNSESAGSDPWANDADGPDAPF